MYRTLPKDPAAVPRVLRRFYLSVVQKTPLRRKESNHFNYAHFDLDSPFSNTLCPTLSTLIVTHYPESVTLYCTLTHFSTLFGQSHLTVDIYTHGEVIYFTLFHKIDHYAVRYQSY